MRLSFEMIAATLLLVAPAVASAEDDLIEKFAATGLNCKVNDPRPGCNKVWKIPPEILVLCEKKSEAKACAELFSALKAGAIVQVQREGQ